MTTRNVEKLTIMGGATLGPDGFVRLVLVIGVNGADVTYTFKIPPQGFVQFVESVSDPIRQHPKAFLNTGTK